MHLPLFQSRFFRFCHHKYSFRCFMIWMFFHATHSSWLLLFSAVTLGAKMFWSKFACAHLVHKSTTYIFQRNPMKDVIIIFKRHEFPQNLAVWAIFLPNNWLFGVFFPAMKNSWWELITHFKKWKEVWNYCSIVTKQSQSDWCPYWPFWYFKTGVPNLGYMYPQGYICLSQGVHLFYSCKN